MSRTIQLPDLRAILSALERRVVILERRIRPDGTANPANDDIIFSYAGTLISGVESPPVKVRYNGNVTVLATALGTAGSTSTVLKVNVNGSTVATVTIPSSTADYGPNVGVRLNAEDRLSLEIDTAGTDAADLTATARFG